MKRSGRGQGLISLAKELGFLDLVNVVRLGTDSTAAKSFVSRQGFGKMKHIEIRDMWLQKEVRDGKVEVSKIRGDENPADLMTKVLGIKYVEERLSVRHDLGSRIFVYGSICGSFYFQRNSSCFANKWLDDLDDYSMG